MAGFLLANKDLIKSRFRAQLEAQGGNLHDSSDFFASVLRRMDGRLASGGVGGDVVEFLQHLYLETLIDYARAARESEEAARGHQASIAAGAADDPQATRTTASALRQACERISEQDEQIIRLRAAGLNHNAIAATLGLTASNVRQRWSRLLRTELQPPWNKAS